MSEGVTGRPFLIAGIALLLLPRFGLLAHLDSEWLVALVDWLGVGMVAGFAALLFARRRRLPADPVVGWTLGGGGLLGAVGVVSGQGLWVVVGFSLLAGGLTRTLVLLGSDAHDGVIRRLGDRRP